MEHGHTCAHTYTRTHACTPTHMCACACTHTQTHTHTHTHTTRAFTHTTTHTKHTHTPHVHSLTPNTHTHVLKQDPNPQMVKKNANFNKQCKSLRGGGGGHFFPWIWIKLIGGVGGGGGHIFFCHDGYVMVHCIFAWQDREDWIPGWERVAGAALQSLLFGVGLPRQCRRGTERHQPLTDLMIGEEVVGGNGGNTGVYAIFWCTPVIVDAEVLTQMGIFAPHSSLVCQVGDLCQRWWAGVMMKVIGDHQFVKCTKRPWKCLP